MTPREQASNLGFALWDASPAMMPECHHHNDIEVNYIERGSFTYLHGGQLIELGKGTLAVFWAGRPHQVVELRGDPHFRGLSIPLNWFLNWEMPAALVHHIMDGEMIFPPVEGPVGSFPTLIRQWIADLSEDTAELRKTMLLEVQAWFRRVGLSLGPQPESTGRFARSRALGPKDGLEKVEEMARYIHEHYMDVLTTPEVAAAVGLHPNYAVQLFHRKTGSTLVDFITKQRLAHAQLHLATTDTQVLQIALESGFGSASRFYAVFRETFHMSPSEYRAMVRKPRGHE